MLRRKYIHPLTTKTNSMNIQYNLNIKYNIRVHYKKKHALAYYKKQI